jgi:CRISPR-associated endonuclease/helicase Cas3
MQRVLFELSLTQARRAIQGIGFGLVGVTPGLGFQELFGLPAGAQPNDMQVKAHEMIKRPGVYVIEAPMGMGKTEAALWIAYELLVEQKARGIYFALPTQATSNRIHIRMGEFVERIAASSVKTRLIHGNSLLMQSEPEIIPTGTQQGSWEKYLTSKEVFEGKTET